MRVTNSLALFSTLLFAGCGKHIATDARNSLDVLERMATAIDTPGDDTRIKQWVEVATKVDDGDRNFNDDEARAIVSQLDGRTRNFGYYVVHALRSAPEENPSSPSMHDSSNNIHEALGQ